MDSTATARSEVHLINTIFKAHGIRAGIDPSGAGSLLAPQFWAYRVLLDTSQPPEGVLKLHKSIAEIISNHRRNPTPVRFQLTPLAVEVPALQPKSIDWKAARWKNGAGKMIAGQSYSLFHGAQPLVLDIHRQHHILIAGMSGAGKSILLQMLLTTLAANTSPADCQYWFVDRKNADLVDLAALPHVTAHARSADDSNTLVAALSAELERRIQTRTKTPHIVLAVDELAALSQDKESAARINDLLNRGRSNGISLLLATQHPTKEAIGSISLANITARCVGAVQTASIASFATGRPDTGAHYLTLRSGSFLYIEGPEIVRFQSYLVNESDIPEMIAGIRQIWPTAGSSTAAQGAPPASTGRIGFDSNPAIPPAVVETFRDYYDPATGDLRWGGLSAIIRTMFGPHANTGGSNKQRAEATVAHLKTTTTTAYAAQTARYQPKSGQREE